MDTRNSSDNQASISNEERIGEVEFLRRKVIVKERVKGSPFFNFQVFTDGQEQHNEIVEQERAKSQRKP